MLARLIRPIDFATREDDGVFLLVCTQMDLRSALVVMRRMAGALRSAFVAWRPPESVTVNVTLATFKAGDTLDSLMLRVMGSRVVAAE
jgi:PleD family two-component response regulator